MQDSDVPLCMRLTLAMLSSHAQTPCTWPVHHSHLPRVCVCVHLQGGKLARVGGDQAAGVRLMHAHAPLMPSDQHRPLGILRMPQQAPSQPEVGTRLLRVERGKLVVNQGIALGPRASAGGGLPPYPSVPKWDRGPSAGGGLPQYPAVPSWDSPKWDSEVARVVASKDGLLPSMGGAPHTQGPGRRGDDGISCFGKGSGSAECGSET